MTPITRRTALKQAFIVAGGTIFLPACTQHTDTTPTTTAEALADTLIPGDTTPGDSTLGAKAVGAHAFALKMIRDCYPQKQQQQYARGLQAFEAEAKKRYGKPFADCDQTQRNAFLAELDKIPGTQNDLAYFFHENKSLVIRGWLGSQYFLTKIEVYELVPGRWHGCIPITKKS
jgi:hypothetical protein